MSWAESFVITVIFGVVGVFLCVSVPGCEQKKREAIVECSKTHSPAECVQAIRE